ncbi:efflux RND transporter permease subunit [Escherichia coli]|nr:hypothetical protein [Escherichia coli]EEW7665072.1 hypothetical protein [Escherichia coli]EGL8659878.1 hypothetical protein [Escherichia coli]EGL8746024.1 hypothetical protein [Escherichia coli]CAD5568536.1 acriflavin resistance protein B [Escherichia coli]
MLNGTGRYLIVYGVIVLGMAWLFARLPTAFLPSEDQGVLATQAVLPAGATQERSQQILDKIND